MVNPTTTSPRRRPRSSRPSERNAAYAAVGATGPVSEAEAGALFAPLSGFPRLALAVSGGADSMALLFLLHRWCSQRADRPNLTVLSVDHGLRPEAAAEAASVGRLAARFGLPHGLLAWDHRGAGRGGLQGGLQARAREARYDLMSAYCHANGIPALVTAHHLDDQAETLLMRLKRGSGLAGLAAIPADGDWAGIAVRRPLLDLPKQRLVASLEAAGIGWVEDPSNRDPRFERAVLRRRAGSLAALGLTREALARSAKRLRRAETALERASEAFLRDHAGLSPAGYASLDLQSLLAASDEIALRVLSRLIAIAGGQPQPLRLSKLEALLDSMRAEPGKTRTLGGCRIAPHKGRLGLYRELRNGRLPELRLLPGEQALWDKRFLVGLAASETGPATVRPLGEEAWRRLGEDEPWLEALPRFAGASLPSCWREQRLLAVACEGLEPRNSALKPAFSARFVRAPFAAAGLG
jgi:tRNA(Ile)-lysidine synthase